MERIKVGRQIHARFSPAQKRRVKKARKLIAQELPDLIRRNQMRHDARKEKTFSGALRRAIHRFPRSPMKIAAKAGIAWTELASFLTGETTMPSDAIDRLVKVLKLKQPTTKPNPRSSKTKAS
jgi:hypothetical protein